MRLDGKEAITLIKRAVSGDQEALQQLAQSVQGQSLKNFNAQCWTDITMFATVAKYLLDSGYSLRSNSEILHTCVELIYNTIIKKGIPPFIEANDALFYLRERGLSTRQYCADKRAKNGLTRRLQVESILGDELERKPTVNTKDVVAEAVARMESGDFNMTNFEEKERQRTEAIKNIGKPGTTGPTVVKE